MSTSLMLLSLCRMWLTSRRCWTPAPWAGAGPDRIVPLQVLEPLRHHRHGLAFLSVLLVHVLAQGALHGYPPAFAQVVSRGFGLRVPGLDPKEVRLFRVPVDRQDESC